MQFLPTKHQRARSLWNLETLVFEERDKTEYPLKICLSKERTNNKINLDMTPGSGACFSKLRRSFPAQKVVMVCAYFKKLVFWYIFQIRKGNVITRFHA